MTLFYFTRGSARCGHRAALAILLTAILLTSVALAQLPLPTQTSSLFSGSGNCAMCHEASMMMGNTALKENGVDVSPVTLWRSSMMGNSAKDPLWRAKVSAEVAEHPELQQLIENKCPRCHAPMGITQAFHDGDTLYSIAQMAHDTLALDGVSCTACHQIADTLLGTAASFTGHYHIGDMREIYGPFADPSTMPMMMRVNYMPMQASHIGGSALCGTCHVLFTPTISDSHQVTGQFPEQETFIEWQKSRFPSQNVQCQTCHMPQSPDSIRIATMPRMLAKRAPFFKEYFVGGNVFMQTLFGDNITRLGLTASRANYDTTRMHALNSLHNQAAALSADWFSTGQSMDVSVRVANLTGHKLPTGIPFRRRIWIHLRAEDAGGQTVWESGAWDQSGEIIGRDVPFEPHYQSITSPDQVQIYEDVMRDLNGNVTLGFLRAADYIKDNRLPPAGFDSAACFNDTVAVHGDAATDPDFNREGSLWGTGADIVHYHIPQAARVTVELCYQSVAPELIHYLRGFNTPEVLRFDSLYATQNYAPVIMSTLTLQSPESAPVAGEGHPTSYALLQNYPNPFNPTTCIAFDLVKSGFVTLKVYNVLGQQVAWVVNGNLSEGRHIVNFDASHLASGIYLYRLEANGFSAEKKMLLMK